MFNVKSGGRTGFLRDLYIKKPVLRREALACLLLYRNSAKNLYPPRKGIWSRFYEEPRGKYIHKKLGEHLIKKQGSLCCYCRDRVFHGANSNIEHVLPIKHYPMFAFEFNNLALACVTCNALKSDDDLYRIEELVGVYKDNSFECFHPCLDDYEDHVDFLKLQTNRVYVRVFSYKSARGRVLCDELLKKVSLFNVKEQANPVVAEAVKKLGEHLSAKPGCESAASILKRLAANI